MTPVYNILCPIIWTFPGIGAVAELSRYAHNIFPASIIIDADTLLDACNGDINRPLPWNTDGFHPELKIEPSEDEVDKSANKQADKKVDKATFTNEECGSCSYVAGQLDAIFHCMQNGRLSMRDVIEETGRSAAEIGRLYGMWIHHAEE